MTDNKSANSTRPLCVDLDGTLLLGDVGIESALALLKRNPLYLFAMLFWLARGYAVLKRNIAQRIALDPRTLPYDERVLDWVKAESETRPCLLVTASDALLADPVGEHLGCFAQVIASDGKTNLAGANKARALTQRYGERGFDYAGNSGSDLAVWPHAHASIVANANPRLLRIITGQFQPEKTFPRRGHRLRTWIQALRLHQWVKNLLLFVPLLGAHLLDDTQRVLQAAVAWLLFGLCTSGTYLINDLLDLQADRQHPQKRHRALASGRLDLQHGLLAAPALIAIAFMAAALFLPLTFVAWLAAYLALTLSYSFWLKRLIVIDALVLASLFTFRILAGGSATEVEVSPWLLTLSMLAFFSLALLKRHVELHDLQARKKAQASGRGYRRQHLKLVWWLGIITGLATLILLGAYIESPTSQALYQHHGILWLLIPLLAGWLGRLWWLAKSGQMHEDPIMFALRDAPSWLTALIGLGVLWIAT